MHADTVHDRGVALIDEALRDRPGFVCDLSEGLAGANDIDVVLNLIVGHLIERALVSRRTAGTAEERTAEVRVVAEAANGISVECHELARAQTAR